MIHYLVTAEHDYTLEAFLGHWSPELASEIQLLHYEDLQSRDRLPTGAYIFSDLERLAGERMAMAVRLWEQLSTAGDRVRLVNDPRRVLRRYELLSKLHESGTNAFAATRLDERRRSLELPVFMRYEDRHTGSATPLLRTKDEVEKVIVRAAIRGQRLKDLMLVEYCDTSDADGLYRKYSSFFVAGRVIPAHIFFSRRWIVKDRDAQDERTLEIEREYLETNPHQDFVSEIFRVANVDYGRIDYSLLGDRPQAWEINTNPHISGWPHEFTVERRPRHARFAKQLAAAISALDDDLVVKGNVTITVGRTGFAPPAARHRSLLRSLRDRLVGSPKARERVQGLLGVLAPVFYPFRRPILWMVERHLAAR